MSKFSSNMTIIKNMFSGVLKTITNIRYLKINIKILSILIIILSVSFNSPTFRTESFANTHSSLVEYNEPSNYTRLNEEELKEMINRYENLDYVNVKDILKKGQETVLANAYHETLTTKNTENFSIYIMLLSIIFDAKTN